MLTGRLTSKRDAQKGLMREIEAVQPVIGPKTLEGKTLLSWGLYSW